MNSTVTSAFYPRRRSRAHARALRSRHARAASPRSPPVAAAVLRPPSTSSPRPPTDTADNYTGPRRRTRTCRPSRSTCGRTSAPSNRCGGCHHEGGQSPQFARSDDVNLAYQAAAAAGEPDQPDQSTLVLKVGGGHNCWVADPSACASTHAGVDPGWIGAGSASTTSVTLVAPPVQAAGGGKQFPATDHGQPELPEHRLPAAHAVLRRLPHARAPRPPQQPYFASSDINEAYAGGAVEDQPVAAEPVALLRAPGHRVPPLLGHARPGGAPDCPGSAAAMLAAITAFANGIPVTPIDPSLVVSNAMTLTQGS